ncbi:MAG: hypothetical protein JNL36_04295 [Candidatus Kapabacteria bacterium]|nr:hypothetical protein [Candidatus Kapabacteria bacterium]
MSLKEAVLKSLDELKIPSDYVEVFNYIVSNKLLDGSYRVNEISINSVLGTFIRVGDVRVSRIRRNRYLYYLTKHENLIQPDTSSQSNQIESNIQNSGIENSEEIFLNRDNFQSENYLKSNKSSTSSEASYLEEHLHKLLSAFLKKSRDIETKTINHRKNPSDNKSVWTNPDIIGVKFANKEQLTNDFIRTFYKDHLFELYSFEIKKEIRSDVELKEAYFQAVSNSSWANYGYLVALDFPNKLLNEMSRLNQSFGIGFIKLKPNTFESVVMLEAKYKDLDLITIDKLMGNNDVNAILTSLLKVLSAKPENIDIFMENFKKCLDPQFKEDKEVIEHCKLYNIPFEKDDFDEALID